MYITSDLHFYHKNIIKYCPKSRPFSCEEEMNEIIVKNWNDKIGKNDSVYILGDVSFGKPSATIQLLNRLNGRKKLIVGNHDTDKYLSEDDFCSCFEWMKVYNIEKILGKYVVMFHYPILEWDKKHYGSYHFFGHCHSTNKDKLSCRRFDVGIDGSPDFAPYNMESLFEEIEKRMTR